MLSNPTHFFLVGFTVTDRSTCTATERCEKYFWDEVIILLINIIDDSSNSFLLYKGIDPDAFLFQKLFNSDENASWVFNER
jgi:hypothetical protein